MPPQTVAGGLLHTLWRVDTQQGCYAIKELSPDIDLQNTQIIHNYDLTEQIATTFAQRDIPAIAAISHAGKYLMLLEGQGFLVYPWIEGKALTANKITAKHAMKIASILAKMHAMHLAVPELIMPEFPIHPDEELVNLIHQATNQGASFAKALQDNAPLLLTCNEGYRQAIRLLAATWVVSHGDLDPKNVLWDRHEAPLLIDWESARLINPTYEIVNAAFDWSGITTEWNQVIFKGMLNAYQGAGGYIETSLLQAACYGVIGNWLHWLVYNIRRASNATDKQQNALSVEQINMVLPTMQRVSQFIPNIHQIIQ